MEAVKAMLLGWHGSCFLLRLYIAGCYRIFRQKYEGVSIMRNMIVFLGISLVILGAGCQKSFDLTPTAPPFIPPSPTFTVVPGAPSSTPSVVPNATAVFTKTDTPLALPSSTATPVDSATPGVTASPTVAITLIPIGTPTITSLFTSSPTNTPIPANTFTATATITTTGGWVLATATSTPTPMDTFTATATITTTGGWVAASATPTFSNTPSPTATSTDTPFGTPTKTGTATHTPTDTRTPTHTPTSTHTPTVTPTPTTIPPGTVVIGTTANFSEILANSTVPVVLEFWASWCATCTYYSPVVTQFATDYAGQVLVVRVNADQNMALLTKYGVPIAGTNTYGLPETIFFKNGTEILDATGYQSEASLAAILSSL